jgi:Ca2+-transporting ATPase
MITGDHKLTAMAVSKELGLAGTALTGYEMDKINDEEFENVVENVGVYARVSPYHKTRIVKAWQKKGEIVVMTGDGINDAPAIKAADAGVAMGITGTDVTKESSDMVLADDNFASIISAIHEGRVAYDNIRKYLLYLLSSNISEILIMLIAGILGWQNVPLIASQILWVNLLTDGPPALALGVDPPVFDVMDRPPRDPKESVFAGMKGYFVLISAIETIGVIGLFLWAGGPSATGLQLAKARSIVLTTLITFELFNAFMCRSLKYSIFKLKIQTNKWLVYAVISQFALLFMVISLPFFNPIMHTAPLSLIEYAIAIGVGFTILPIVELYKLFGNRLGILKS